MSVHDLISNASQGDVPSAADVMELDAVITRYPWFTTARILRQAASGKPDAILNIHLQAWGRPPIMLAPQVIPHTVDIPQENMQDDDPIARFLAHGDYKIVASDAADDRNAAIESESFDLTDETATEQLAEIYLAQGLNREARAIYERLSLLNPEKSVYFAELIARIGCDSGGDGGENQ